MVSVFTPRGVGGRGNYIIPITGIINQSIPVIGELTSGGLISYQGNKKSGMPLIAPLIRAITCWSLGQVHRKVTVCHVHRV